jgi:hypothetical protein
MSQRIHVKIFIASPAELSAERKISMEVLVQLNKFYSHVFLDPIMFELDTSSGNSPGVERIQDHINPLLDGSDIIVVLFYSRIGSFTKEEIDRAIVQKKKIFVYFKEGFSPKSVLQNNEYSEVLGFKQNLDKESKIRYLEFGQTRSFSEILKDDLHAYLNEKYSQNHSDDKEIFINLQIVFDRPAFKGTFLWQTDPMPFKKAFDITSKALTTGILQDRQNTQLRKFEPISMLKDPVLREKMQKVAASVKRSANFITLLTSISDFVEQTRIRAEVDKERDQIMSTLNEIWQQFDIPTLPIPTMVKDSTNVWEQ